MDRLSSDGIRLPRARRIAGPNASERLIVTTTEWCLDVLTWDAPNGWPSTYRETLVATLDAFVCGNWPEAH